MTCQDNIKQRIRLALELKAAREMKTTSKQNFHENDFNTECFGTILVFSTNANNKSRHAKSDCKMETKQTVKYICTERDLYETETKEMNRKLNWK